MGGPRASTHKHKRLVSTRKSLVERILRLWPFVGVASEPVQFVELGSYLASGNHFEWRSLRAKKELSRPKNIPPRHQYTLSEHYGCSTFSRATEQQLKSHNATNELENLGDFGIARSVTGAWRPPTSHLTRKNLIHYCDRRKHYFKNWNLRAGLLQCTAR